jgi:hypothetical protein
LSLKSEIERASLWLLVQRLKKRNVLYQGMALAAPNKGGGPSALAAGESAPEGVGFIRAFRHG